MQIISNDQTVRSETVQDLKVFNSQSLATPARTISKTISFYEACCLKRF